MIWKDKVATQTTKDNTSIVVTEDRETAELHRSLFHLLWNNVPEVKG